MGSWKDRSALRLSRKAACSAKGRCRIPLPGGRAIRPGCLLLLGEMACRIPTATPTLPTCLRTLKASPRLRGNHPRNRRSRGMLQRLTPHVSRQGHYPAGWMPILNITPHPISCPTTTACLCHRPSPTSRS